ncbi:amidohydrolase family protein [Candidatus Latescibacterota bacterium]
MSEYFDYIHEGRPIDDIEIIDAHAHLGPSGGFHVPKCSPEDMIRMMDTCGIDKTVVSPTPGITGDMVFGNNLMLDEVKKHRGRLYGACYVNGNYPELSVDELNRCFGEDSDVVIMKIHPILAKCGMNDRRMKKMYEFASARKLFVIVHTWLDEDPYGNLDIFSGVVRDYPDINWLMGHSGGPYGGRRAVEIAIESPNVFLDITMSMCPARQIEFFVGEVGSERVIFATDNPFIDPRPSIGRIALAEISREDMINIFGGNAKRLTGI